MAIKASIYHLTHYKYDKPVRLGPQIIRLKPAAHSKTKVISHSLKVTPENHFVTLQQDPYGNYLSRYVFPDPVTEFKIEVDLVADMTVYNPFDFFIEEDAETFPFSYPEDIRDDLKIYMQPEPMSPALEAYINGIDLTPTRTIDFIVGLNARLQQKVNYIIRMEPGVQTPEETLQLALGSCRDSSWLLVQILRNLGLAARFVSGYLIQLAPDLKALDGPSGTEVDFTDLHAWCEVYIPGAGWVGLDPTSGLLTGESHIPLAATPHYRNAAPISGGLYGDANTTFDFAMTVSRVAEHPRITKPFSEESWQALNALGEHVDTVLNGADVRLTMGGEPTFVSIDDFESEEWNTGAVGPTKRDKADELIRRLRERFAPGGFLHYGQGKWYPGESLPRWTFSLYWRKDGKPIWHDPDLIAAEGKDTNVTATEAEALITGIAAALEIEQEMVIPAFEDPAEWIIKEGSLPENVDPDNSKLESPEERARIAKVFARGLTTPTGYILPVQAWNSKAEGQKWISEKWRTRRGKIFLIPGDSPIGFRMPLGTLPYVPPSQYPYIHEADPSIPRDPLPDYGAPARALAEASRKAAAEARQKRVEQVLEAANADIRGAVRTAHERRAARWPPLCVHATGRAHRGLSRPDRGGRKSRRRSRSAHPYRRLFAAAGRAHQRHARRTRPRRHRSQHPSGLQLGRLRRHHHGDLRGGPSHPPWRRQVHDRRPSHRHRRRQPCRCRRQQSQQQPLPAPAGFAEKPDPALAAPSIDVLPVFRHVHRPDQPGAARR